MNALLLLLALQGADPYEFESMSQWQVGEYPVGTTRQFSAYRTSANRKAKLSLFCYVGQDYLGLTVDTKGGLSAAKSGKAIVSIGSAVPTDAASWRYSANSASLSDKASVGRIAARLTGKEKFAWIFATPAGGAMVTAGFDTTGAPEAIRKMFAGCKMPLPVDDAGAKPQ